MDDKRKIDVTEEYRTLMEDPSQVENMSVETLKAISKLIKDQNNLFGTDSQENKNSKGHSLGLSSPYYKGKENMTENKFNRRIDGYAGPIILASITMLFGIVFLLIILNY